jgi:site-specific recombinase XerD
VQDRSLRTVESDAADLKDFLRRTGVSDVTSVTVRDIDSYATRMGLDKLERDTLRRRLYTVKSFYDWMHSRGHVQAHPMADFRIPRRRTSETGAIFSEAEVPENHLQVQAATAQPAAAGDGHAQRDSLRPPLRSDGIA